VDDVCRPWHFSMSESTETVQPCRVRPVRATLLYISRLSLSSSSKYDSTLTISRLYFNVIANQSSRMSSRPQSPSTNLRAPPAMEGPKESAVSRVCFFRSSNCFYIVILIVSAAPNSATDIHLFPPLPRPNRLSKSLSPNPLPHSPSATNHRPRTNKVVPPPLYIQTRALLSLRLHL
jgi:hypothetical protein